MLCPVCKCTLNLRQINLETAVYLCEQQNCTYPSGGHEWKTVPRKLEDMYKPLEDNSENKSDQVDFKTEAVSTDLDDLNDWLNTDVSESQVTDNGDLFDLGQLEMSLLNTSTDCGNSLRATESNLTTVDEFQDPKNTFVGSKDLDTRFTERRLAEKPKNEAKTVFVRKEDAESVDEKRSECDYVQETPTENYFSWTKVQNVSKNKWEFDEDENSLLGKIEKNDIVSFLRTLPTNRSKAVDD